ncbi:MAG: hypothetical protein KF726_03985 [Anaerolineae bacterium]|nr:hypothetical protein [Anaerolineae bacterium]
MHPSRSRSRALMWLFGAFFIGLLAISGVGYSQYNVAAQDSLQPQTFTPQPSPTDNGGSAIWTVEDVIFNSQYPRGGRFTIKVNNSIAKIVSAQVIYQHNPAARQRANATFDADSGYWIARMPGSDLPQWVAVDYYWRLTDAAGNVYQTETINDAYTDTRREWRMAESEDIIVYWEDSLPEQMGDAVIEAMHERRQFYYDAWGKLLGYRPRAIIYDGDHPEVLEEWSYRNYTTEPGATTYLGGFTTREYGAFVGIYYASRESVRRFAYGTVLHEVGHLYQYENGGMGFSSAIWFIEGDAEYNSDHSSSLRRALQVARQLAASGDLPPLDEIGRTDRMAYDVGYAFFKWFTEKYGEGAHLELMQLVSRGIGVEKALERYTGMSFYEVETEFRDWLGAPNAALPTMMPTPTINFFASPTFVPTKTPKP